MLKFTEAAENQLQEVLEAHEAVRVAVVGGGCAGMSYMINIADDDEKDEEDLQIDIGAVRVYVDPHSADILKNTKIDYVSTLQSKGFVFMNSEANTTCGCGMSFS